MKSVRQSCGPCVDRAITVHLDLYLLVQIAYKNFITISLLHLYFQCWSFHWIAASEKEKLVGFWLWWQSASWLIQCFLVFFVGLWVWFFFKVDKWYYASLIDTQGSAQNSFPVVK